MANIELVKTLARRALSDSIWKSCLIEGLHTAFSTVEVVMYSPSSKVLTSTYEVEFILNMKDAWGYLFEDLGEPNALNTLMQFNKIVGWRLFYNAGEIRHHGVTVMGSIAKFPIPVRTDIVEELKQLSTIEDPVAKAVSYFCYIAKKQMFADGNKRVAQLVCNKILVESGIGYLVIPADEIATLCKYLVEYYDTDNVNNLFDFLMSCIVYVKE